MQSNTLNPVPSNSQLLNWADYGYALIPMSGGEQPQSVERTPERLSSPAWLKDNNVTT
jgi:hypothetical protein